MYVGIYSKCNYQSTNQIYICVYIESIMYYVQLWINQLNPWRNQPETGEWRLLNVGVSVFAKTTRHSCHNSYRVTENFFLFLVFFFYVSWMNSSPFFCPHPPRKGHLCDQPFFPRRARFFFFDFCGFSRTGLVWTGTYYCCCVFRGKLEILEISTPLAGWMDMVIPPDWRFFCLRMVTISVIPDTTINTVLEDRQGLYRYLAWVSGQHKYCWYTVVLSCLILIVV